MKRLTTCLLFIAFIATANTTSVRAQAEKLKEGANKPAAKVTVPVFRLHGSLSETASDAGSLFGGSESPSLADLTARLKKAREDSGVKAIVLKVDGFGISTPMAEELRQSLAALRAAGKEVFAHADELSMTDYELLSGASHLSVVPTGDVWLTGVYGESPYLRGLLDLLGVKPDFLTCGDYKSAAEIFMRTGPSPEAEKMQNWLLDGQYEIQLKLIASGRGATPEKARQWVDGGPYSASKAKEAGLIDAVQHVAEFEAMVKERCGGNVKFDHKYGAKAEAAVDFSSPLGLMSFYSELLSGGKKKKTYKDSVAIVYVEGPIELGSGSGFNPLSPGGPEAASTPLRKALEEAAEDNSIKAVVLRVNSPGGSAVASEIILAATKRVKAKKPLVVSMGEVAGSGGYYVACASDVIFANESTITGSIGVVGGKYATSDAWQKVGIHWKGYGRGANASMLSSSHTFTPEQRTKMQSWMDEIYGVFKGHVTAIRGDRLKKPIDELAGGRVYTGKQALELGLVDKIGTLDDAVKFAAAEAKLEKYELRVVPEAKSFLEKLLDDSGDKNDANHVSLRASGLTGSPQASLLTAALPHLQSLDPQRMTAIRLALRRLEMLQTEGAVLMMPELVLDR